MPRFPRYNVKSKYLHIMTQGHNKRYIFDRDEDVKYYIKIMYASSVKNNIKIIAYCIMSNHTHMLVETSCIDKISQYMHEINTKYGMYYNKKYDLVGYVFRNRYRLQEIYDERQLYTCIKYIYDNPVKAGICASAKDYLYSNYKEMSGELVDDFTLIETEEDKEFVIENILKEEVIRNRLKLEELKDDVDWLENIIWILRSNNISLRRIARELDIGREKVRQIYNKLAVKKGRPH